MIVSFRKWKQRLTFVLLLTVLSCVLYLLLGAASVWLQPVPKYRVPVGHSTKVFQQEALDERRLSMVDRLLLFYRDGE